MLMVRRLAALRRFGVDRFFRDAREVDARFLRFAMYSPLSEQACNKENLLAKRDRQSADKRSKSVSLAWHQIPQCFDGKCLEFVMEPERL
jgi:hypothetical protein